MTTEAKSSDLGRFITKFLVDRGYAKGIALLKERGYEIRVLKNTKVSLTEEGLALPDCERKSLLVTEHAKERIEQYTGEEPNDNTLLSWLAGGKCIPYEDVLALGFRPAERHRENSFYVVVTLPCD